MPSPLPPPPPPLASGLPSDADPPSGPGWAAGAGGIPGVGGGGVLGARGDSGGGGLPDGREVPGTGGLPSGPEVPGAGGPPAARGASGGQGSGTWRAPGDIPLPGADGAAGGAGGSLAERLDGLLFFPVTAFAPDGSLDLDAFRAHVRRGVEAGAGAVFACCGTGEFHALAPGEFAECVAAAVEVAAGRVPVVAGAGYGTALACEFARLAERAGADGLLAMPPYLVLADQRGLLRHYAELAAATGLETIVYQRDNAILTPETVAELAGQPRIIGLKDGHGDLDLMQRVITRVRAADPAGTFRFFNGLPTAELTALAYRALGVDLYSSAVFCFAPEIALAFHRALGAGDEKTVRTLLDGFYVPLVELRNRGKGYAVSLVKAGVRLRGRDVGPVRAPLSEPEPAHVEELAALIDRGLALVGAGPGAPQARGAGGGR